MLWYGGTPTTLQSYFIEFPKFYSVGSKKFFNVTNEPLIIRVCKWNAISWNYRTEKKNIIRDTFGGPKKIVNENFISSRVIYLNVTVPWAGIQDTCSNLSRKKMKESHCLLPTNEVHTRIKLGKAKVYDCDFDCLVPVKKESKKQKGKAG